ncbi:MAG: hypothetical protein Aurels2KO_07810 [Aureliella sp.]
MFGELEALLSLVCSTAALLSTGYFWLVRNNLERQNLSIQTLSPLSGSVVLVQEDTFPYDTLVCRDDQHWARYQCQLVIVNNSVLPNSILSLRVWLAAPDGSWADAHARISDNSALPVSLPPSSTTRLDTTLYVPVGQRGSDRKQRIENAMKALHSERRIRVKVQTLNQNEFQFDIVAQPLQVDPLMRAA